jgi:hypothetical protein
VSLNHNSASMGEPLKVSAVSFGNASSASLTKPSRRKKAEILTHVRCTEAPVSASRRDASATGFAKWASNPARTAASTSELCP